MMDLEYTQYYWDEYINNETFKFKLNVEDGGNDICEVTIRHDPTADDPCWEVAYYSEYQEEEIYETFGYDFKLLDIELLLKDTEGVTSVEWVG